MLYLCQRSDERKIKTMSAPVSVTNDELRSTRETVQGLGRLLDALEAGKVDKFVITQQNRMRGVLISLDEYARLIDAAEQHV